MKHLKVGDQAPEFTSTDHKDSKVSLGQFKGKKVVIYFYPKDNTPGCTAQACNIRDNYELIQSKGIVIIGVSADSVDKHKSFIKKYDLPFILLADTEKKLLNLYGVWGEKKFMGKIYDGIHRTTFILDEQHKIISIIDKPKTKEHSREILEAYEPLK
ncbi:MAG: thioredoxin-dependent thiol peroxidase [Crocinitomicaceae bacterium]|nr:thioredoxin-dependent thiol peroxidase [Crocinitomicaceae bacterium]|tara:strand:- start:2088 stop:2558 length:471 start_codon:yes stop_codon:yes gene_type:complete